MRFGAVALALSLAACAPPRAAVPDAGGTADSDAAPPRPDGGPLTERSCATHFEVHPDGAPMRVDVAGAWDWSAREQMAPDGTGGFALDETFAPGIYAYKFVVTDGDGTEHWIFDPGNPYRAYDGGVENSGLRVDDCRDPLLVKQSFAADPVRATVRLVLGAGGAAPASIAVRLRRDFTDTAVDATVSGDTIDVAVDNLPPGKYALLFDATDEAGRAAETLRLPFWIEAESFDWRDAVIYMVMTDRFRDGDPSNDPPPTAGAEPSADWQGGDLAGITAAIDDGTFDDLGVRALWISPLSTNAAGVHSENGHGVTAYHGYWPVRAREIDPRFGTDAELETLVKAAHARGIRVMLDYVLNHVHEDHEYFAAHPEWFRTGCICGTAGCDWTERRLDCQFHDYMPDVDWTNTDASEAFIADAIWWVERFDLDGLRVDAVKHVEDLAIVNLSTRIGEQLEQAGTEVFLLGETAMGWAGHDVEANRNEYDTISRYIGPNGLNGQFDFVLYHATAYRVFANDEYGMLHLDYWTRASLDNYPSYAVMTPYIGSHDTERFHTLATYRGTDGIAYHKWPGDGLPAPTTDAAFARARVAYAWLLTAPGAPLLYYGDEYGEHGGGDPDNRHMWRPPADRTAAQQAQHDWIAAVSRARRDSVALRRGGYRSLRATETFLAFARATDTDLAVVALNHSDAPASETVPIDADLPAPAELVNVLDPDAPAIPVAGGAIQVELPPRSAAVFTARR